MPRPREFDPDAALELAMQVFWSQGYEATSLREIAEELGVTKAALYYHFPTKDDIVRSMIDERIADRQLLKLLRARENAQPPAVRRKLGVPVRASLAGTGELREQPGADVFEHRHEQRPLRREVLVEDRLRDSRREGEVVQAFRTEG